MKRQFHKIGLFIMVVFLVGTAHARKKKKEIPPPELNEKGKEYAAAYQKELDALNKEIIAALPKVDVKKKEAFLQARTLWDKVKGLGKEPTGEEIQANKDAKALAKEQCAIVFKPIFADLNAFLSKSNLDEKMIKAKILHHGTPKHLAIFAQQSDKHKALLDQLFADKALMRQMVLANGANGGEYGRAMAIYTEILEASPNARKPGILQRLALGTALMMPWKNGQEKRHSPSTVYRTHVVDQVPRFLHYEKAFLNNELDPAFKDMNTWECRFITNSEYSNEDLTWARHMMRNFRPDIIKWEDEGWRYSFFIKSDVPYTSTKNDPSLGTRAQEEICLGGICGRRAFLGRLTTRAFGIPTRASTQVGHAAMCRWTSKGWIINLGAWWSFAYCGPQGGEDFYLDSRAREFPEEYMKVLRAQWIGNALGEKDVSIRSYAKGGGFWDGLAFHIKELISQKMAKDEAEAKLASLSAEEGRLLGESDNMLKKKEIKPIEIPEAFSKIDISKDGAITVPAVACSSPKNNTEKVLFLNSWGGKGMQLHYQRLGQRPEILRYTVNAPSAGKYELSLNVCTVSKKYEVIARINRRNIVNLLLPFTKGEWEDTNSQVIELREGRNSIQFTFRAPNRGVSFKSFKLKPVK